MHGIVEASVKADDAEVDCSAQQVNNKHEGNYL